MATRDEIHVDEPSLGSLFSRMAGDMGNLVRKEIELAKIETKQEVSQAAKAGGMFGGAAVAGHMALLFFSIALAFVLDHFIPNALAFAIVGAIYAITAAVLAKQGQAKAKQLKTLPETTETLKEDAQWVKTRNS